MSAEKMRKDFEAWSNTHYLLSELNWAIKDGEYEEPEMQYAWDAWQASRAAIEVELPKVAEYFDQSEYPHTCEMLERDLRSRIESLGLKVKP